MKRVVNFSGGLCSFWTAKRVVERFGVDDVFLLFADTLIEDDDLHRFNAECSAHLDIPITRVSREKTPWELFREHKMIGNSRVPLCSIHLKREVLDEWHRQHCLELDSIIYIGFDWLEASRLQDIRQRNPFWKFEAPMLEAPLWDKCKMMEEAEKLGIRAPRLNRLGFPHNNCGGGCVRAGISHFVHMLRVIPDIYAVWESEELKTQQVIAGDDPDSGRFTILKDRRNKDFRPLSLQELRLRVEAGERFSQTNWGGCGCGAQYAHSDS